MNYYTLRVVPLYCYCGIKSYAVPRTYTCSSQNESRAKAYSEAERHYRDCTIALVSKDVMLISHDRKMRKMLFPMERIQ